MAIVAVFVADYLFLGWGLPAQIGKLLERVIEWMAVWR